MEVIAFFATIIAGFFCALYFGYLLSWPDAGTVVSIATMGTFILWAIRHPKDK
jgi:hypothetical protein